MCHATALKVFEEKIFTKYKAEYFFCENCQFLHVDSPTWLDEAYQEPINKEDTGILIRNETIRNNLSIILHALFDSNAKFLDFAGGYGFLTRMMRDVGFDFYWYDEYTMNLTAQGFEGDLTQQYDAVTAFEIFEHLENPINELEKLLSITNTIIFSTEILPSTIPKPQNWEYYGLTHGQHISFYSSHTFDYLAKKYNLKCYFILGLHILTNKDIHAFQFEITSFGAVQNMKKSKTFEDSRRMARAKSKKEQSEH